MFLCYSAAVAPKDPDRLEGAQRLRTVLAAALTRSGVSWKEAAITMRLGSSQLSMDLTSGNIHGWRLFRLPPKALAWIAVMLAAEYGIPEECETGSALAKAIGKKKMAKAAIDQDEVEKAG
jgi:hypothetical protein